jgi:hypothetical protein
MKKSMKTFALLWFVILCFAMSVSQVHAQSGYGSATMKSIKDRNSSKQYSSNNMQRRLNSRSVAPSGVPGVNRKTFGGGGGGGAPKRSKPFKGLNRGPSVSPYLALSGSLNGVSNYYNNIRPQQQQARTNANMQRQTMANSRRLNQMAAAGPYNLQGDPYLAPTGHQATYMNFNNFQSTGNYFAPPQGLQKQR